MDETRDVVRFLVDHADSILGSLPAPLSKLARRLVDESVVAFEAQAATCLHEIAHNMPNTVILEHETGCGDFLTFYYPSALVNSLATVIDTGEESASNHSISHDRDLPMNTTLLDAITAELFGASTARNKLERELRELTVAPSALERRRLNKAREFVNDAHVEICSSTSRAECLAAGRQECRNRIHFERVVTSSTDLSLGDCSYLDTCFKGRACKYVHYRIVYPSSVTASVSNKTTTTGLQIVGAQSLNCDILSLDLRVLGSDWAALIIDPPWDIHTNGAGSAGPAGPAGTNENGAHGIVTDRDVLALDVGTLQTEGVAFLWVTGRVIDVGRQCLARWGYEHVEELVWCKTNQLARTISTGRTGHWLNHTKEHVLVGVKGPAPWLMRHIDVDVLVSTARGRSHKPEELYTIVDRLAGPQSKKLELFGRPENLRRGWLTVGNELGQTRVTDPELLARFNRLVPN